MNDIELDKLIAATAPFGDEEVGRWDLAGPETDLRGAIMATTSAGEPVVFTTRDPGGTPHQAADDGVVHPRSR
jgi:hypothetical protein